MTYEPRKTDSGSDWGAIVQRQIDAGNVKWRPGFDPARAKSSASADTAGKPVNMPTLDQLRRRYPGAFAPKVALPKGQARPLLREAERMAEAMRRARAGDVAEASGLVGEARSLESPRDGYFRVILPGGE